MKGQRKYGMLPPPRDQGRAVEGYGEQKPDSKRDKGADGCPLAGASGRTLYRRVEGEKGKI